MANHTIGPNNSVEGSGVALQDPNGGKLTVKKNGHLISTDNHAVVLGGAWVVSVLGKVVTKGSVPDVDTALYLTGSAVGLFSSVTVGPKGQVLAQNGSTAIFSYHRADIVNEGKVLGGHDAGIWLGDSANGKFKIVNKGVVKSKKTLEQDAAIWIDGTGTHTIKNTGTVNGTWSIFARDGHEKVTNSGTLKGTVELRGGNDVVNNSGKIVGLVHLGDGNNKLTNSGKINGAVIFSTGDNTLVNKSEIVGTVTFGTGNNTFTNSGTIGDRVLFGTGNNVLTNSGKVDGNVNFGAGDNVFTNFQKVGGKIKSGTVTGEIRLGNGDGLFKGGNKAETVRDSGGSDVYKLGGGNDTYLAVKVGGGEDGIDKVDGGKGKDTYDASDATNGVIVDLKNGDTFGQDVGTDKIKNFENAKGGSGNDLIVGTGGANRLFGNAGQDALFGLGGNDTLIGGAGPDELTGGRGKDILWGGNRGGSGDGAADVFRFTSINDSGTTKKTRDVIMDFEDGLDRIDLQNIDANQKKNSPSNDEFNWIGVNAKFTGSAGDLRVRDIGNNKYIVEGDVTGNKKADFSIEVRSAGGAINWSADDFFGVG